MNKVFHLAAKVGLISALVLFGTLILVLLCDFLIGAKHDGKWLIAPQIVAFVAALLWLVCTILVWIEGWTFIAEESRNRSWMLSALLILALVFFSIPAAYVFHFLRKNRSQLNQEPIQSTI